MKLATWNVNSLKARVPRVLELLETHRPDVVFLQETKCEPDAFPVLEPWSDIGTPEEFERVLLAFATGEEE